MGYSYQAVARSAVVLFLLLLAGCSTNDSAGDVSVVNQSVNETVDVEGVADGFLDGFRSNGFVSGVSGFFDAVVKELFGSNGWVVIGIAVLLLLAIRYFGWVGILITFLVFAYAIRGVL